MPYEMFGVSVRRRARTRQSSLVFASALVHAGIVVAIIVTSMLLPGVLPTPRGGTQLDAPGLVQGDFNLSGIAGHTIETAPPPVLAQEPAAPVRLHAGIEAPRKFHDVMPVYPALARASGASGVVIIEATIDARGDVVAAKVLRSVPLLDQAAVDAVRQWKYTPARLNGETVAVLITVTVNFTLAAR